MTGDEGVSHSFHLFGSSSFPLSMSMAPLALGFVPAVSPGYLKARKRLSAVFFGLGLRPLVKIFYLIANLCSHNINPQPPALSVRLYYLYKSRTTVERSKKMRC